MCAPVRCRYTDVVHVGVAYLGCFRVCTVSQFILQDACDGATELRKDLESDLRTAASDSARFEREKGLCSEPHGCIHAHDHVHICIHSPISINVH